MQSICDGLIQLLLLLHCSSTIQRDLDEDTRLGTMNAEIVGIEVPACPWMLCNDLKAIILRHADHSDELAVNDLPDAGLVLRELAFNEVDSDQGHTSSLLRCF